MSGSTKAGSSPRLATSRWWLSPRHMNSPCLSFLMRKMVPPILLLCCEERWGSRVKCLARGLEIMSAL